MFLEVSALLASACDDRLITNYMALLNIAPPSAAGTVDVTLKPTVTGPQIAKIRAFLRTQPGAGPVRYVPASRVLDEKCEPILSADVTVSGTPQPATPSP